MSETETDIISGASKTTAKITKLASRLNPRNQSYVLNTINALLYAQQISKGESKGT